MKGNDGTGNTIERDDWQTPQWLFNKLNNQYTFSFDCCSTWKNTKCDAYSDNFKSIPKQNIKNETVWMNPPFSKAREMFEHFFNVVNKGVCIYRCDNLETALWQEVILKYATWIFIPKGRISYEGKEGTFEQTNKLNNNWANEMEEYGGFSVIRYNNGVFERLRETGEWLMIKKRLFAEEINLNQKANKEIKIVIKKDLDKDKYTAFYADRKDNFHHIKAWTEDEIKEIIKKRIKKFAQDKENDQ